MSILFAACVSFFGLMLVVHHMSSAWMRRLVGFKGIVDIVLHGTIIYMFFGTSTLGLLQAELCGIMFSVYLRAYRWLFGYERWLSPANARNSFMGRRWVRFAGALTRVAR